MVSPRSIFGCAATTLVALATTSCGPKQKPTYPTEGKLLINGQPAANVTVFFNAINPADAESTRAYATTTADGTFSLTTHNAYDGAPEGEYVVTLLYEPLMSPLSRPKGKPPTFDKKYTNPAASPLRAKVEKKPQNVLDPFDVK